MHVLTIVIIIHVHVHVHVLTIVITIHVHILRGLVHNIDIGTSGCVVILVSLQFAPFTPKVATCLTHATSSCQSK